MTPTLYILALLVAAPQGAAQSFSFLDPKTGAALVRGVEETSREDELVVTTTVVRDLEEKVLSRERCVYDPRTLALVSYEHTDYGAADGKGEHQALEVKGKKAMLLRRDGAAEPKIDQVAWTERTYSAKLLGVLIERHWEVLERGDEFAFDMFVPAMAARFGFRLRFSARNGAERTVRAEPTNFLLRPFVPRIEFVYEEAPGAKPTLKRYEGPSSVELAGERHKPIVIQFDPALAGRPSATGH